MAQRKYHYVYALIDPRDLRPFYIGKGTGTRKVQHFQNIPKSLQGEPATAKYKRIQEIKSEKLKPIASVLSHHATDEEALEAEKKMIESIGLDHLTNQNAGGGGDVSKKSKHDTTKGLTIKQEKFCQNVASGTFPSIADAYRDAYNCVKSSANTIYVKASQLRALDKIGVRLEELREPAVKKTQVDLQYCIEGQQRAAELADETGNAGAMSGAYRELGRLTDVYPAEKSKVEVTGDELLVRIAAGRQRISE